MLEYNVGSVSPSTGHISGGVSVVVNGQGFYNTHQIKCKFGSIVVDGDYIDETTITCVAPRQQRQEREGHMVVAVEVSLLNDMFTSNGVTFTYFQCPTTTPDLECSGHGVCHPDATCSCAGYWGHSCQHPCPSIHNQTCAGHSASSNSTCNIDTGECSCITGYYGQLCDQVCQCKNNATCTNTGGCICPDGYTGPDCSTACRGKTETHTHCYGNGQCESGSGKCICDPGFDNSNDCQTACPNLCSDHGVCYNNVCQCVSGYYSSEGDIANGVPCMHVCPGGANNTCSGHGVCLSDGTCQCSSAYYGLDCGQECPGFIDKDTACSSNGVCVNGDCVCNQGWNDDYNCTYRECGHDCYRNGVCKKEANGIGEYCDCSPGWKGLYCSTPNTTEPASIHGVINFEYAKLTVDEGTQFQVVVKRERGAYGHVSVSVKAQSIHAVEGLDFYVNTQELEWRDGDDTERTIDVEVLGDTVSEDDELFVVSFDQLSGGCVAGVNNSVTITIASNQGTATFIEIITRLIHEAYEANSHERSVLEHQFVSDVASALGTARTRIVVSRLDGIDKEENTFLLHFDITKALTASEGAAAAEKSSMQLGMLFIELVKNESSVLYEGAITRYIDVSFMPVITTSTPPSNNGNRGGGGDKGSGRLSPGVIVVIVLLPLLFIACAVVVYVKRKPLVDYLLWKLGGFRFTQMINDSSLELEGNSSSDDVNLADMEAKDVDIVSGFEVGKGIVDDEDDDTNLFGRDVLDRDEDDLAGHIQYDGFIPPPSGREDQQL